MKFNDDYEIAWTDRNTKWYDEVIIKNEDHILITCKTIIRFKESDLSGDEFRTSTSWISEDRQFGSFSDVKSAIDGLFYYTQDFSGIVDRVEILRKNRRLQLCRFNNISFTVASAMLPYLYNCALDDYTNTDEAWHDMRNLCHQHGCTEPWSTVYRLKMCYRHDGSSYPAIDKVNGLPFVRAFCKAHKNRGDCCLEDCNSNYEVVDGTRHKTTDSKRTA